MKSAVMRRMESERRLQTIYENRAVREKRIGRALPDSESEIQESGRGKDSDLLKELREMARLESERSERYEDERAFRQAILEKIWNLRTLNVPEEEIRAKTERLKEYASRMKQLDAAVEPAKGVLLVTRQLEREIARIRMDAAVPFASETSVLKALETVKRLEQAIGRFHEAYGQKWAVSNLRERIVAAAWSGRSGHFREIVQRVFCIIRYCTASPHQRSRIWTPGESAQRAGGADQSEKSDVSGAQADCMGKGISA